MPVRFFFCFLNLVLIFQEEDLKISSVTYCFVSPIVRKKYGYCSRSSNEIPSAEYVMTLILKCFEIPAIGSTASLHADEVNKQKKLMKTLCNWKFHSLFIDICFSFNKFKEIRDSQMSYSQGPRTPIKCLRCE